ncbi:MAG: PorT family protein [Sphingobacteriaceae bacterium]|nr:PorT family protein [Sphingobacteriaceae bacterium]
MQAKVKTGFVLGMIFLFTNTFGQSVDTITTEASKKARVKQNTYLNPFIRLVGTSLNYGSSNSELADYKKQIVGARAGVTFQAGLTPSFSLASELYVIMKGGKLKADNPITGNETTDRLYAVELPILARFHVGKFHVNAGPSVGYNIYGTRKMNDVRRDLSFGNSRQDFKRFEAGIQAGGGYTFKTKHQMATVDLRYNHGLTNISNAREIYNRNVMVSLHIYRPWKSSPFSSARKK